jgi:hypothetical protein
LRARELISDGLQLLSPLLITVTLSGIRCSHLHLTRSSDKDSKSSGDDSGVVVAVYVGDGEGGTYCCNRVLDAFRVAR